MRIAVPYENENGTVFQHFGHSQAFKLYDVKDNAVEGSEVIGTEGSGHGALSELLQAHEVDVLICGGIGAGAIEALGEAGIRICAGVKGAADEAVAQHLAGTLAYTTEANCSHGASGGNGHCGRHHGEGHAHAHRHGQGGAGMGEGRCSHRGKGGPHGHGGHQK